MKVFVYILNLHSIMAARPATQKAISVASKRVVHIWQGERDDACLVFMYKPIIDSLFKIIRFYYPILQIDYQVDFYDWNKIKKGDVLLWVGCIKIPDFLSLRKKKIYTIYYNTEPFFEYYESNELWTYSKFMQIHYESRNNQIIRFVPILADPYCPSIPYEKKNVNSKIIFMGNLSYRQDKYNQFSDFFKKRIIEIYDLWDEERYESFITHKPFVYLNLLKSNNHVLPSVRINKLLNYKAIIISEHTNPIDEILYKDIVFFCDLNQIETLFYNLIKKSPIKLKKMSEKIYQLFVNRFTCSNNPKILQ